MRNLLLCVALLIAPVPVLANACTDPTGDITKITYSGGVQRIFVSPAFLELDYGTEQALVAAISLLCSGPRPADEVILFDAEGHRVGWYSRSSGLEMR